MSSYGSISAFRGVAQSSSSLINDQVPLDADASECLIVGQTAQFTITDGGGFLLLPFDTVIRPSTVATLAGGAVTISRSGLYNLDATCLFLSSPALVNGGEGTRRLQVLVNGATVITSDNRAIGGATQGMTCSQFIALNAGDIVRCQVSSAVGAIGQTTGGAGFNPILTSLAVALL